MDKKEMTWIESLANINIDKQEEEQQARHAERSVLDPHDMRNSLTEAFHMITDNRAEKYRWSTALGNYVERRPSEYSPEEIAEAHKCVVQFGTPVDQNVLRRFRTGGLGFSREHERLALEIFVEYETMFVMRRYRELKEQGLIP